jgi:cobalamin biosynthesis Mg chelatase CobN
MHITSLSSLDPSFTSTHQLVHQPSFSTCFNQTHNQAKEQILRTTIPSNLQPSKMHTKTEATTTTTYKPSLVERMRGAKTTRATRLANTSTRSTRGMTGTTGTTTGTQGTTTTHSTGVGRRHNHNHNHATGTTVTPRRQQRKTTLGDKVSRAFMKATGRLGQKVCFIY